MKNITQKHIIRYAMVIGIICCFFQSNISFGKDIEQPDKPVCIPGGGGFTISPHHFSQCYDCSKKVVFSEEKLKKAFPEIFSEEEINQYVQEFFQIGPYTELKYDPKKRYCFEFSNGQFYKLYNNAIKGSEHPIYEDTQIGTKESDSFNDEGDFIHHYINGQLKEKRESTKNGKEFYYESYYNNGQIRSKEWYVVIKRPSSFCYVSKDNNGNETTDCTYLSKELVGLEEYYKNGQLRLKIEKGSAKKEFTRTDHANYLTIPYEMYDRNGKLKEKCFEDGTTEKYWENGNLKTKCNPVDGGELAGEQCCNEYDENGEETGMVSCSHWMS